MPLTKQQVADARKVYDLFWDSYIKGDVDTFASTLDDKFEMIGTSESERCHTKVEGIEFFKGQVEELVGKAEMRNRQIHAMPLEGMVLINELCDIYVLAETDWNFYSIIRISTFLRETPDGWKVVQQHGSLPDNRVQEGETLAIDKISRENIELRDAVKRRTAELESKNRELEIEAAVERVRAEAMAMQSTNDFEKVTRQLLAQIKNLNLDGFTGASICMIDENQFMSWWDFSSPGNVADPESQTLRYDAYKYKILGLDVLKKWQTGELYMEFDYDLESLHAAVKEWESINADIANAFKEALLKGKLTHQWNPCGRISNGLLAFDMIRPPDDDVRKITIKMAHAFEQAHTRFLDLQKAEAQAREAQIEAALEKVRSRSLAMHKSEELVEVDKVIIEQIKALDIDLFGVGIHICHEDEPVSKAWMGDPTEGGLFGGDRQFPKIIYEHNHDSFSELIYRGWKQGESFLTETVHGDRLKEHMGYVSSIVPDEAMPDSSTPPELLIYHLAYFSQGFLVFVSTTPRLDEYTVFIRLAKVFEQAYTRFLDLQKAEDQALEAQIEAALEKVRSRSLAMHKSDELNEVVSVLFEKLKDLQIPFTAVGIATRIEGSKDLNGFVCGQNDSGLVITNYRIPYFDNPIPKDLYSTLEKQLDFYVGHYSKEEKDAFYEYVLEHTAEFRHLPEDIKHMIFESPVYTITHVATKNAVFNINDFEGKVLADHEVDIIKRFARVFDQAYTRFLDLQKAEAQARDAEIQLALERVRARAMAMQKSDELSDVIALISEQLDTLQIPVDDGIALITFEEDSKDLNEWMANEGFETATNFHLPFFDHPVLSNLWEAKEQGQKELIQRYSAEENRSFLNHIFQHTDFSHTPESVKEYCLAAETYATSIAFQKNTAIFINDYSGVSLSESQMAILHRFAKEFDQTYTRFLDLQKAEIQAREAQIEAALERARAQSMMMQHSDEIKSISNAFHEQLILLGIPSEFSYVWLPDEANETHQFWASWSEVKAGENSLQSKQFTYPLDKSEPYTAACFAAWATPDVVLEEFIPPTDISGFFDVWKELLSGAKKLKPDYFPKGIYYSEAYMRYGCFGINIRRKLSEEEKNILNRFSKEFERTYTRFLDLQTAEKQSLVIREERDRLEIALNELRATQEQLVQQEKLASLGQLTAGIAHEIKNPLNFVNNFSEVSLELLEEVLEEVKTHGHTSHGHASHGHTSDDHASQQTITEILNDVKSNLTKIHEHGSRADNIVKSMLQHSRGGTGKKEPTDLNALIKEYVNLSFHGMRAGKNPINVDIQLDLDDSMGKVNLIGEDFSRVILNLCNNAFDALKSVKTQRHTSLNVRTKKRNNSITIEIEDNGSGIPDQIRDKIMQPFFTTKKGTQGTGLGLSITNDIVKAHGGELTVTSQTGTGTTIMIKLPKMN